MSEHSQGVCPNCKSANFVQSKDLKSFKCKDCGLTFYLEACLEEVK